MRQSVIEKVKGTLNGIRILKELYSVYLKQKMSYCFECWHPVRSERSAPVNPDITLALDRADSWI